MSEENPSVDQEPIEKPADKQKTSSTSEHHSANRIAVVIALIGVVGVISAALIASITQYIVSERVILATATAEVRATQIAESQAATATPTTNIVITATSTITTLISIFTETPTSTNTLVWTPDPTDTPTSIATVTEVSSPTATNTAIPPMPTATLTSTVTDTPVPTPTLTPQPLRLCSIDTQLVVGKNLKLCGKGQPGSVIELRRQESVIGNPVLVNGQGDWSMIVEMDKPGTYEFEVIQLTNQVQTGIVGITVNVTAATPTSTMTSTPTAVVTATKTATTTPVSTATNIPINMPTAVTVSTTTPTPLVPTQIPTLLSNTSYSQIKLHNPTIVNNKQVTLSWEVAPLALGDHYAVIVAHGGGENWVVTDSTSWTTSDWIYNFPKAGGFTWYVAVCRGGPLGDASANPGCTLLARSNIETFTWDTKPQPTDDEPDNGSDDVTPCTPATC